MSDQGEWRERLGRVPGAGEEMPSVVIRMNSATDDLSRVRGMAEAAANLQKSLAANKVMYLPPQVHIDLNPPPQKHRPLIPFWVPCFILGCAAVIAGVSEFREMPVVIVLIVWAMILMPASFVGLGERRESKTARFWSEVGALEMDIYGEYVSSETMRRFGGGLPQ